MAKPNIQLDESLLLSNDLQDTEKQLLNEWKRFRQVSLNNYDPNFKSTILNKLFQVAKNTSTTSTVSSSSLIDKKTILVDDGDNDNCNNNNAGQQNLESQAKQQTPKMNK